MQSKATLEAWRLRVDNVLAKHLPDPSDAPKRLHEAMRYTVLGDGKRLRPLLVYATAAALGAPPLDDDDALDHAAAAVEMIHAYSLVHDDLPAMDDDALRRGRPTVHIAYDEATAILVGDALQAEAIGVLASAPAAPAAVVACLAALSQAAGSRGMCGGQAIDMAMTGLTQSIDELAHMHRLKTGALIEVSLVMAGLLRGADAATLDALRRVGTALGLAFQIKDDLLDAEADSQTLGKTAGKDQAQGKSTYVGLLGVDGARQRMAAVTAELDAALATLLGPTDAAKQNGQALSDLAVMAVQRSR